MFEKEKIYLDPEAFGTGTYVILRRPYGGMC
jgi:hypothetical protein